MEDLLTQILEVGRTIANLPSVRSVTGKNLSSNYKENVDPARFPSEGVQTVQQLYNNIANRGASEVYFIRQGFNPHVEKPFFMFDSLVLQAGRDENGDDESSLPADFPEESEEEEYEHYPKQLARFARDYPKFTFKRLEDIPFVASPAMRTCDNTQYLSKSKDNLRDSYGILFSVPVYGNDGKFSGIISVIVRSNIFEALLLDVPFLIVTDSDREEAAKSGFAMPKDHGRFLLRNAAHGLEIYDRRNADLPSSLEDGESLVLRRQIGEITLSPWEMNYLVDRSALAEDLFQIRRNLASQVIVFLLIAGFITYFIRNNRKHREALGAGVAKAVGEIGGVVDGVSRGNRELDAIAQTIKDSSSTQAATIEEISASMLEISSIVAETLENTRLTKECASEAAAIVVRSGEAMTQTLSATRDVTALTEEINGIAFQTNLLALNASVEAARAGKAGSGFAVVAGEVRTLAMRAAQIAERIGEVASNGTATAERSGKLISETIPQVEETAKLVAAIERSCTEQDHSIQETTSALQILEQSVQGLSTASEGLAQSSTELSGKAEELSETVENLKSSS